MWEFCKPEWRLLKLPKMWGVPVPPESPTMKMGVGKVIRYDGLACPKVAGNQNGFKL